MREGHHLGRWGPHPDNRQTSPSSSAHPDGIWAASTQARLVARKLLASPVGDGLPLVSLAVEVGDPGDDGQR